MLKADRVGGTVRWRPRRRQGQGYVEYALDIIVVSLLVFMLAQVVAPWVHGMYTAVVDHIAKVIAKI
ncbi:MAG: hypothetical protein HY815_15330 [Candidatus Riflebacteria bacterium]|nr:hypothetical protein [Candidatus Riflebacteria bacterium]